MDNQAPDPEADSEPVEVPHNLLSGETLRSVAESFVLREGTDYGAQEYTHEEKVAQVLAALERGEARLLFDPVTESVALHTINK
ncbi:MAG: YheU family protein [Steroidobacteraceae bacterium]